jgi:pimeloyl-ACP methyl ester carboxylesterase
MSRLSVLYAPLLALVTIFALFSTRTDAAADDDTTPSAAPGATLAPSDDDDDATQPAAPKALAPGPATSGGPLRVKIWDEGQVFVWPPTGIPGRPLIVSFHGSGWSGDKEMGGWIGLARQHNFTIVCPDYVTTATVIQGEKGYLDDIITWIKGNLQYDQANVYVTGFSAGGLFVWWNGSEHPDFFHGLFLQSANFYGADISRWYNRPIKVIWGSNDIPHVIAQNEQAAAMLHESHCKTWTTEIIQGAHHQPHHDMVVAWMEQVMAPAAPSSSGSTSMSSDDGSSGDSSSPQPSAAKPSSTQPSATVLPPDDSN